MNNNQLSKNHKPKFQYGLIGILLLASCSNLDNHRIPTETDKKSVVTADCVPLASWVAPGVGEQSNTEVIANAAQHSVVLLGENHINREHHRWQLQTLAALYTLRPDMVIGFEMFPRRVQAVLDKWIAGELEEKEFLREVQWNLVWSFDASLYLPLFHFARMNKIPMRALNIATSLRKKVTAKGFDNVPEEERGGITRPAKPSKAYLDFLLPIYQQHDRENKKEGEIDHDDADFRLFIAGQQLWDRAMAEVIYSALDVTDENKPLVVGVMGRGHIVHGYGVPHQLHDLGVKDVISLLPWDVGQSCKRLVPGLADAVFGVAPYVSQPTLQSYQRLGIRFEIAHGGAHILQVEKDSIAEESQLQAADVIIKVAGLEVKGTNDLIKVIKRHAPGTWLPLTVKRDDQLIEIIAKFPAVGNK